MALLSTDQILGADDLATEDVSVPEWGGEVRIKTLTGKQRDKFESSMVRINKAGKPEQNIENVRARLIQLCAINDEGLPLFTEKDIERLGAKSASNLDIVFAACQRLNGFTKEDIEDLAEGFGDAPSEDSTSD